MLNQRYVNNNYLKYYKLAKRDICSHYEITENQLESLLFMYDYEFFTRKHIAEALHQNQDKFYERVLIPMFKYGYVERIYDRTDLEKVTMEQLVFLNYDKTSYRARYQITQKARLLVQRFYRKIEGEESIKIQPRKFSGDGRQE